MNKSQKFRLLQEKEELDYLGFFKETEIVPTENNLIEAADYRFFLKLFFV